MSIIYNPKQINIIKKNIKKLEKNALREKQSILEPTLDEMNNIRDIILKFISDKKRIIYGGYASHLLLINKKQEGVYDLSIDTPDVEFYTPEPIKDLIDLCNVLYKHKLKYIQGKTAGHEETYSIFVNFENVCDLSYVPPNFYKKMDTITINNNRIVHPKYEIINWLRQFTDPLTAGWRWEKQFIRMEKIQKTYPFENIKGNIVNKISNEHKNAITDILDNFIKPRETIILFNYFAYNKFMKMGGKKEIDIPYLDIVSVDYINDGKKLINFLKKKYKNDIKIIEYYPFFQYYKYNAKILYKKKTLINIYHHNNKCTPFKMSNDGFKIASFSFNLLMLLILQEKAKNDNIDFINKNYKIMFNNLIDVRNDYLTKKKKTILDNTIFEDFFVNCLGTTMTQPRLYRLKIRKKIKQGKRATFNYEPSDKETYNLPDFKFSNSSGNKIINSKYLKFNI